MTPENNLKIWNQASGQTTAKQDLQTARSIECRPEFMGLNLWQTPSTTRAGIVYRQEVFFAGFSNDYTHGLDLNIECTCPSRVTCKHILKIQRVYCANWSYLFTLFGMEESKRMSELWSRAQAIYERMERSSQRIAA